MKDKVYDPDEKLLKAKDAIFKLIHQFHCVSNLFEDGELYIYNYCESALERAFDVLDIEGDYIKLMDFCQMWEENTRAFWIINNPYRPFGGFTAQEYYDDFKRKYELKNKLADEDESHITHTKTDFTIATSEDGDWEALYINGRLEAEGHNIRAADVLDCIDDILPNKVTHLRIPQNIAEAGMPMCVDEFNKRKEDSL